VTNKDFDPRNYLELVLACVAIAGIGLPLLFANVTFIQVVSTMLVILGVVIILLLMVWFRLETIVARLEERLDKLERDDEAESQRVN
jgi:hypothetical protein